MPLIWGGGEYHSLHNPLNSPLHFCKSSPKNSPNLSFSPKLERFIEPQCFALKAKDDDLRLNSSSGGAFSLIAEYVLSRGGVVFGASFDDNLNVIHRFIEKPEQLELLRRSKYVESFIGDSYKKAKEFLKANRLVLFSGVQCQIHALNAFLRKPYHNLITIEVVCNSVPSSKIWDIYKESLLDENGEKLIDFNFRGKDFGWENGIFAVKTKTKTKTKTIPHYMSSFMEGFLNHTLTRKSCANCYSKGFVSGADFVDDKGVSCVMAHTQKAMDILDSLQQSVHLIRTTASIITLGNPATLHSNPISSKRNFILKQIIEIYQSTKDAKKAMAILSQYMQNPTKITPLRHYYLVWKNDPLRKGISNALKKIRKRIFHQNKRDS